MSANAPSPERSAPAPAPTLSSVLATGHVAPTLILSLVARLPLGAVTLIFMLRVAEAHNYASAGVVDAAFGVCYGIAQPFWSRLVDRHGQTAVLVPTALLGAASLTAFALAPDTTPVAGFAALAAIAALSQPPLGGAMRALWDFMLPSDEERHVGYSIDAGTAELIWTGGPLLLVGTFTAAYGAEYGLLLCAAILLAGALGFAGSLPSRRWQPSATDAPRGFLGPLRAPGVATIVLVGACAGAHFNAIALSVTAFGRAHGSTSAVGVLLAVWAAGSLVAGLLLTRVAPPASPARRLALVMGIMGGVGATLGLAGSPLVAGFILLISGAGVAPYFVTLNVALGDAAPEGMLTEAYGLVATAATVGAALTVPVIGAVIDHVGVGAACSVAGALPLLAVIVLAVRHATLRPHEAGAPAAEPHGASVTQIDVTPVG